MLLLWIPMAIDLVSTNGLATGTTVVNGVTFTRTNLFGNSYGFSSGVTTADAATDALYTNAGYSGGTITLTGLNIGDQYEIQAFHGDNRGGALSTRVMNVGDGTTVATTSGAVSTSGSWIIGTFTADAATQDFHSSHGTNVSSELNAYQLRNVTVPEPSSTALLGLGGLALILRRRK